MYGKARFAALCTDLQQKFSDSVQICMQTNAMLVDEEWVSIFERHKVAVGVSIDGPPSVHDANRVDKKGRATSSRVEAGIRRLVQAAAEAANVLRRGLCHALALGRGHRKNCECFACEQRG
jgi:uncharacterized protein